MRTTHCTAGDSALGYDLANANAVNMDYEAHVARGGAVPDVVLVRKSYEARRKRGGGRGGRLWKLKHLPIEAGEDRCGCWLPPPQQQQRFASVWHPPACS